MRECVCLVCHIAIDPMGPLSFNQSPMAMARAALAPRGPGTLGVGCVPSTRCRGCAMCMVKSRVRSRRGGIWPWEWGHCRWLPIDFGDAKQPNAAVTQRPSSVVRAPSLGGRGHDMLARFKLKCGVSCQGAKGQGALARSHSRLLASRANGRPACSPMFGACFPCPPLSTTASPLVMKSTSNVRATRPPHQVPDALPSLPERRK